MSSFKRHQGECLRPYKRRKILRRLVRLSVEPFGGLKHMSFILVPQLGEDINRAFSSRPGRAIRLCRRPAARDVNPRPHGSLARFAAECQPARRISGAVNERRE